MRRMRVLPALLCAGALGAALAAAGEASPGFDRLKQLVGEWEATGEHGATKVSYRLVSGGTALMEQIGPREMVTMYHPDGASLMLTHYCEGNNQPRMRANGLSKDGRSIEFKFVDVTNEAAAAEGIMRNVKFIFTDADHFTQEWTNSKNGKEEIWSFNYTRSK